MTVHFELRGLGALRGTLDALARKELARAARDTVNDLAFAGRAAWQDEMSRALTLRNRFTERRALVDMARSTRFGSIDAVLGHTEDYMARLEEGGTETARAHVRAIPTETAAGQAVGSLQGGRKRLVRPSSWLTRLGSLGVKGAGNRSRKANNARAIRGAIKSGKRLALLDLGRRKGIYRVMGGKRKPRIVKLYDLSRRTTHVPRIPTLERAVLRACAMGPAFAHHRLGQALDRARGVE